MVPWLENQIDDGSPPVDSGSIVSRLIDFLVNKYGSWSAVPEEIKEALFGGDDDNGGYHGSATSQGMEAASLLGRFYSLLYGSDPASEGTPDFHLGLGYNDPYDDPYNPVPVEAPRPGLHGRDFEDLAERVEEGEGSLGGYGGGQAFFSVPSGEPHATDFDPSAVPKERLDALVADGLAERYTYETINVGGNGTSVVVEVIVVDTPMGKLVFKRNENQTPSTPWNRVDPFTDSYSLIDKTVSTYPSDLIGEMYTTDPARLAQQQRWAAGLTFALHMVPFGAAADEASQGNYGEAGLNVAADVALFFVPVGKLAKLRPGALRGLRGAEIGVEAGIGLYRAGQAIDILQREDGTLAEASGPAGEAFLRLLGISPSAAKALSKFGNYKVELDPTYLGSGLGAMQGLRVVRLAKEEIEAASLKRLMNDPQYKGRNLRESPDPLVDWIDERGLEYDQMGNLNMIPHWGIQKSKFFKEIKKHLIKADFTVIDLTGFPQGIKDDVSEYILDLPQHDFDKIIPIGF